MYWHFIFIYRYIYIYIYEALQILSLKMKSAVDSYDWLIHPFLEILRFS